MRDARSLLITLLLVVLSVAGAQATSYVVVADAPLADESEFIVTAKIAGQRVSSETGRVMTHYTALVDEVIKGAVRSSALEVRVLGGLDEETGHYLKIFGVPEFGDGERVLLFLGQNADGSYHVVHMLLGAFHQLKAGGESFWVRSIEDEHVVAAGPGVAPVTEGMERDGKLFVDWLKDRASGVEYTFDYYRAVPEESNFVSQFTIIGGGNDVLRWFDFDDGGKVVWKLHKKKHKAVKTKGKGQMKNSFSILNKVKERPGATLAAPLTAVSKPTINLSYGGKHKSKMGFDGFDGQNVVLGKDYGDWISTDFSCSSGGTLAIGGISAVYTQLRSFRGKMVRAIAEGEMVINNGTDCFFKRQGAFANRIDGDREVYLHEFMHTLGVGHTCGDDNSPSCSKSARANDSNMRASVHGTGVHDDGLGTEDIAALQYIYTSDPNAPVPSKKLVPGSKKFCKKAKGCGEGQGNCKKNKQCNGTLVCKKSVGAQFGLPPKTNVCTAS